MFTKKEVKLNSNNMETFIGQGTVIEGKIKSDVNLHIEGTIQGGIECSVDVTVGLYGSVKLYTNARNITLAGKLVGNISATERVLITATGELTGNITAKSLVIHEGGVFDGQSNMIGSVNTSDNKEIHLEFKPDQQNFDISAVS